MILHDLTAPDRVGFFLNLGTPVIGNRAVYPVIASTVDLFPKGELKMGDMPVADVAMPGKTPVM